MDLALLQNVLNEESERYQDYDLNLFVEVVNDTTSEIAGLKIPNKTSEVLKPGGTNFRLQFHALVSYRTAINSFSANGHATHYTDAWPTKNVLQMILNQAVCDLTEKARTTLRELEGLV